MHIIIHNNYKIIDAAHCKQLKKKLASYGFSVRTQKVNKADAIFAHLQKEARILIGSNNLTLCGKLIKTKEKSSDMSIDFTLQDLQEMQEDQPGVGSYFYEKLQFYASRQPSL